MLGVWQICHEKMAQDKAHSLYMPNCRGTLVFVLQNLLLWSSKAKSPQPFAWQLVWSVWCWHTKVARLPIIHCLHQNLMEAYCPFTTVFFFLVSSVTAHLSLSQPLFYEQGSRSCYGCPSITYTSTVFTASWTSKHNSASHILCTTVIVQ